MSGSSIALLGCWPAMPAGSAVWIVKDQGFDFSLLGANYK